MKYQDMTDLLYRNACNQATAIMEQIKEHCQDEYAVKAVLIREIFVSNCIAANLATRDCNDGLDRFKKPNSQIDAVLEIIEGKKDAS